MVDLQILNFKDQIQIPSDSPFRQRSYRRVMDGCWPSLCNNRCTTSIKLTDKRLPSRVMRGIDCAHSWILKKCFLDLRNFASITDPDLNQGQGSIFKCHIFIFISWCVDSCFFCVLSIFWIMLDYWNDLSDFMKYYCIIDNASDFEGVEWTNFVQKKSVKKTFATTLT